MLQNVFLPKILYSLKWKYYLTEAIADSHRNKSFVFFSEIVMLFGQFYFHMVQNRTNFCRYGFATTFLFGMHFSGFKHRKYETC